MRQSEKMQKAHDNSMPSEKMSHFMKGSSEPLR